MSTTDLRRTLADLPYTRKPTRWDEAKHYIPTLNEARAISELEAVDVLGGPQADLPAGTPQFFVAPRADGLYLVNTEGFSYARYVLRIPYPPGNGKE